MQAWDGWCNYGIAEDDRIKFVIPEEGSDLWTDTMVILKSSENKEAAHAFINYILDPEVHSWVVENILYKVPNEAAMEMIDPSLVKTYPNLGMTPAELLEQEELVDLGDAAPSTPRSPPPSPRADVAVRSGHVRARRPAPAGVLADRAASLAYLGPGLLYLAIFLAGAARP